MADTRYRIVDPYHSEGTPSVREFTVVRKTPSGAWIIPSWRYARLVKPLEDREVKELRDDWGAVFVLDGDGKRHAHETVEMARNSYGIRKRRQIQHAKNSIEAAERGLHWLETGEAPDPEMFAFSLEALSG